MSPGIWVVKLRNPVTSEDLSNGNKITISL